MYFPWSSRHELLGPAVLSLPHQVKNMDNPVSFHAVMQFLQQVQQSLVIQVVDGAGEKNLVKFVCGERTSAQICRDEMHVWSIAITLLCCFDRNGVNVHTVVIEPSKGIGDMPVCKPKSSSLPGGWSFER